MSTPLSSLNKQRRLPVEKSTPTDADKNLAKENPSTDRVNVYRYSNEDAQLLNEVTTRMATENIRVNRAAADSRIRAPTDLDLLQLTMNRMQTAEAEVRYLTSEMKTKTQRIAVLEEKVKLYEKALQNSHDQSFKIPVLEEKCRRLQSIIDRMEDLLIERGLEVIGELDEPDHVNILTFEEADRIEQKLTTVSPTAIWRPDDSIPNEEPIDFNQIIGRIQELNILAGESEMHFQRQSSENHRHISTLKRVDPIPLTLYANGIFLFNGPFRSFTDVSTKQFIRDIIDGYFPTELQSRFPDGVPFDITDKRDIHFTDQRHNIAFHGEGHVLHDGRVVNDHSLPSPSIKTESKEQRPKISATQFLNRLPKAVIRNGQVIEVRQDIERQLTNRPESSRRCDSAISEIKSDADSSTPFSTLRIRSHDGQQSYVIKMKIDSTIKDVKQILSKKKKLLFDFDLFAMGSKQFFTDESQTLEQCGLIPNATLGIREVKRESGRK